MGGAGSRGGNGSITQQGRHQGEFMDRTYWYEIGQFLPGERVVSQQSGVRLYDGEEKVHV